jgi:hypothetical protein
MQTNKKKEKVMIKKQNVELKKLTKFIEPEMIEAAEPLDLFDYGLDTDLVIVDSTLDLLDGYHRLAGILASDVSMNETIEIIVSDNEELNRFAADKENAELHSAALLIINNLVK